MAKARQYTAVQPTHANLPCQFNTMLLQLLAPPELTALQVGMLGAARVLAAAGGATAAAGDLGQHQFARVLV
jgi:hypothetical protein